MTEEQFGKVTLINGDCMDYLRQLPDKAFKIAIVDPPYGDGNMGGGTTASEGGGRDTANWRRFKQRFDRYRQPPICGNDCKEGRGSQSTGGRHQGGERNHLGRRPAA